MITRRKGRCNLSRVCTEYALCILAGVCGRAGLQGGGGASPEGSLRQLPWSTRPQQTLTGMPQSRVGLSIGPSILGSQGGT